MPIIIYFGSNKRILVDRIINFSDLGSILNAYNTVFGILYAEYFLSIPKTFYKYSKYSIPTF